MEKKQEVEKKETLSFKQHQNMAPNQLLPIVSVCFLCISAGNTIAYTSSAIPTILADNKTFPSLNSHYISWIGGLAPLGAICGSIFSVGLSSHFNDGPRKIIIKFGWPSFILSWTLLVSSYSIWMIFAGRFMGGFGTGIVISLSPIYVIQTAHHFNRGKLGVIPQFLMVIGILLSNIFGSFLTWRYLAMSCGVITLSAGIPLYLAHLFSQPSEEELIKDDSAQSEKKPLIEMFKMLGSRAYLKPFLIALSLIAVQQLTGINGVTFYSVTIFKQTMGDSIWGSHLPSIILAFAQVLASLTSTHFVDKAGRKLLLLVSASTITLSTLALGLYFFFLREVTELFWVPLLLLVFFAFGFALGLGSVTWLLISEILPKEIRQLNGWIIAFSWLCVFLVTSSFPHLLTLTSICIIFWIYSGFGVLGVAFIVFLIPETKGKSIEEIRGIFAKNPDLCIDSRL